MEVPIPMYICMYIFIYIDILDSRLYIRLVIYVNYTLKTSKSFTFLVVN